MKVAITSTGETLDAPLDARFGRAANFLVFDTDDGSLTVADNTPNLNAAQGAGVQSAMTVSRLGAHALITGHCGPKAFRALAAAGIGVYTTDAATAREALARLLAGTLQPAGAADVEGHWA